MGVYALLAFGMIPPSEWLAPLRFPCQGARILEAIISEGWEKRINWLGRRPSDHSCVVNYPERSLPVVFVPMLGKKCVSGVNVICFCEVISDPLSGAGNW